MAITPEGLERIEAAGLKPEQLPRHVAVIMDGNGRWAQRRGLPRLIGHRRGIQSVRAVLHALLEILGASARHERGGGVHQDDVAPGANRAGEQVCQSRMDAWPESPAQRHRALQPSERETCLANLQQ